ncbi:MAG: ABC transporter ATP-binding protein [Bacteroides sp. SM23_62_1]|nr:MAG: ABC transporter ATP-binding protein [Bacteroides sp. SM23_62_1]
MKIVLQTINLHKSYGHVRAVSNLSVSIHEGNVYGILGPNGSGKTTTLAIITGVIRPDLGNFFWFEEKSSHDIRKKIGSLIEIPNFYPYLSLKRNLMIIARIKNVPETDIPRVLDITGLSKRMNSRYDTLSLGMKQRLAVASVLLGNPEVLVLDEPANSLDPEGIAEIRQIIKGEAEKNKTIILASHILDEVEKVCSHVAILKNGEMIAQGKVNELLVSKDPVIISSENLDLLEEELIRSGLTESVNRQNDELLVVLKKGYTTSDINSYAFSKGLVLTRLEIRKRSLESQFLELVK